MSQALPVRRGCGSRREGGVYIECGVTEDGGSPIEAFLFDPPLTDVPDEWLKPHRTPTVFEGDGVSHVVIWVGAEFYPNVFDFIEETRVAGASRRVPSMFDFSKLTAQSRMYFVHASAVVEGPFLTAPTHCPKRLHALDAADETVRIESSRCLGFAKYLPTSDVNGYVTSSVPAGNYRTRTLPCGHSYEMPETPNPVDVPLETRPAIFLQLPLTGIACVNKNDGSFDEKIETRVKTANVPLYRVDK